MQRERPILFSGPMVRAILEGRKTQTRRPIKVDDVYTTVDDTDGKPFAWQSDECGDWYEMPCPFGKPGDLLWVRETWQIFRVYEDTWNGGYEADLWDGPILRERPNHAWVTYAADDPGGRPWRPSIHMPRWASRITLRITGIRVERLCEISVDDAWAEGIEAAIDHDGPVCYLAEFQRLWDAMYAKRGLGWNTNPWVWVMEFETCK